MIDRVRPAVVFGRPIKSLRRYLLDRIVLRPSRGPIDHPLKQRVMLSSQGKPLECFVQRSFEPELEPSAKPDLLVLKFPGTAGRAERSSAFPANLLSKQQSALWTWNPPGYGRSGGRASLEHIANASLDFWRQVVQRESDSSTAVILCGNSLGCVSALHVAAHLENQPKRFGLILRNPPPLVSVVKREANRYPLGHLIGPVAESLSRRMNAALTATRISAPAVFLQSELDSLVLPDFQQQVIDAYGGSKRVVVMEGLDHGGLPTDAHQAAIQQSVDWLWQEMNANP